MQRELPAVTKAGAQVVAIGQGTADEAARVCEQMGVMTIALMVGKTIGPPADRLYAVDPVGVDRMRPSDRNLATY